MKKLTPIALTDEIKTQLGKDVLTTLFTELEKLRANKDPKNQNSKIKIEYGLEDLFRIDKETVKKPIIFIDAETYLEILLIVQKATKEIAWHCLVKQLDSNNPKEKHFYVYKVLMYPQQVSGTFVNVNEEELYKWNETLDDETFNHIRFQGHSHVNMGVFASGTDRATYDNLTNLLQKDDFYIFMIFNKRLETYVELADTEQDILFETADIKVHIVDKQLNKIEEKIDNDIKTYISDLPATIISKTYSKSSYYNDSLYGNYEYEYEEPANTLTTIKTTSSNLRKSLWSLTEKDKENITIDNLLQYSIGELQAYYRYKCSIKTGHKDSRSQAQVEDDITKHIDSVKTKDGVYLTQQEAIAELVFFEIEQQIGFSNVIKTQTLPNQEQKNTTVLEMRQYIVRNSKLTYLDIERHIKRRKKEEKLTEKVIISELFELVKKEKEKERR